MRKKDKFLSLVLKHIDTSAMMDLLLRLISCVEPAALRQDVLNVRAFPTPCPCPAWIGTNGILGCFIPGADPVPGVGVASVGSLSLAVAPGQQPGSLLAAKGFPLIFSWSNHPLVQLESLEKGNLFLPSVQKFRH